ncbi:hypothetical protein QW131_21430 [Roseibium salinum]|nr:hypothetical protein [Roseibium salinum]
MPNCVNSKPLPKNRTHEVSCRTETVKKTRETLAGRRQASASRAMPPDASAMPMNAGGKNTTPKTKPTRSSTFTDGLETGLMAPTGHAGRGRAA